MKVDAFMTDMSKTVNLGNTRNLKNKISKLVFSEEKLILDIIVVTKTWVITYLDRTLITTFVLELLGSLFVDI